MTRRIPRGIPWLPVPTARYQPSGRVLSLVERLVLGVLLRSWMSGEDEQAISMSRIEGATGVTGRAIRSALRSLEADKLVVTVVGGARGRGHTSSYRLTLPQMESRNEMPPSDPRCDGRRNQMPPARLAEGGSAIPLRRQTLQEVAFGPQVRRNGKTEPTSDQREDLRTRACAQAPARARPERDDAGFPITVAQRERALRLAARDGEKLDA